MSLLAATGVHWRVLSLIPAVQEPLTNGANGPREACPDSLRMHCAPSEPHEFVACPATLRSRAARHRLFNRRSSSPRGAQRAEGAAMIPCWSGIALLARRA